MTVFRFQIKPLNTKGFTLLEIMVSIAILAIVLVTLFRLQSGTIKLAGAGKFNCVAPLLARQQLANLELEGWDPADLSGEFGEAFKGYEWSCTIETADFETLEFPSDSQLENFKQIVLEITGGNNAYRLTTWRYLVEKDDH